MKIRDLFVYRGTSTTRVDVVLAVVAFVGFIGFWWAISEYEVVSQRFLPLPWNVVTALYVMFTEQKFLEDVWISVARAH